MTALIGVVASSITGKTALSLSPVRSLSNRVLGCYVWVLTRARYQKGDAMSKAVSASTSEKRVKDSGYWLHWIALVCEAFGSLLVFLEARRLNVILGTAVFHVDYAGQSPPGYQDWWHNSGALGFALLLTGILLTGVALLIGRHRD
ncbi:MAG: hypothetical protein ACREU2_00970 [Steroidobacteraceae bacterium]